MGISKSTFYRDIAELIQLGIVKRVDEGYSIDPRLFPIPYNKKKIEGFKVQLNRIKEESSEHSFEAQPIYPMYKTFFYYYNKGFEGLKMSPEEFVDQLSAGFFTKKKADWEPVQKPVIDYRQYGF